MGYSSEDKAGRKGIETVCRVCQTNGAGPCGEEIIIGSVSVKHGNTIQKRKGGGGARERGVVVGGGPEATVQPQKAHEDPGAPQQHRPCQRMSVIRRLTEVIPWLSPAMQPASLLSAERTERKPERERGGGVHWGAGVLFSAKPCESSAALSEIYNCTFLIFCALLLTVVID